MMHLVSFLLCLHDHVGFPVSFSLSLSVVFLFLCLIFLVEPFSSVLSHHVIILSPFYFIFLCLFNSFSFVLISSSFSLYCVVLYWIFLVGVFLILSFSWVLFIFFSCVFLFISLQTVILCLCSLGFFNFSVSYICLLLWLSLVKIEFFLSVLILFFSLFILFFSYVFHFYHGPVTWFYLLFTVF